MKEIGTCSLDQSQACTGEVKWFANGTQYWNDNISYFRIEVNGIYKIIGSSMSLTRDLNNDGDQNDSGEVITYQRI